MWWRRAAAIVLAGSLLTACSSSSTSVTPPKPTGISAANQAQISQTALDSFGSALADPTGTGTTAAVTTALKAAHTMKVQSASFQYLDQIALTAADLKAFGKQAWAAEVSTSYRLPFDPGPTEMTIAMVFRPTAAGAQIVKIGGYGQRSALWLDVPTQISVSPRLVVIATAGADLASYVAWGQSALTTVAEVLPNWSSPLVIEIPDNQAQLTDVLQTPAAQLADIAAVTTSADGSLTDNSAIHVFANPDVFDTMNREGARVVLAHEATHAATRAPLSRMPTWMLEGFADYVALAHAGIPVQTAAHQIIERMRKSGIPTHLPTPEDLAPTADGLGATYEEAWLVWRYLGQTYGQAKAVAFYYAVNNGATPEKAFQTVLGISQDAFVSGWKADLRSLL